MTRFTARGADTADAMEQIVRRLGNDALIVATRLRDGMVEIEATVPESDMDAPLAEPVPLRTPSGESMAERAKSFADLLEARSDWAPMVKLQPAVPPRRTPWSNVSPQAMDAAFLDKLERDLLVADPVPLGHLLPRTIVVGPPGAGKSLLAVRLAAAAIQKVPGLAPKIIAPRMANLLSEDRLRGWCRLLSMMPERPLIGDLLASDERASPDPASPEIIDMSDVPEATPELAIALSRVAPTEIILALPASFSMRRASQFAKTWAPVSARLCLTFCDQGGPEKAQLSAIAEAGLRLARAAAGKGIIDTISVPARADLARWLQQERDELKLSEDRV